MNLYIKFPQLASMLNLFDTEIKLMMMMVMIIIYTNLARIENPPIWIWILDWTWLSISEIIWNMSIEWWCWFHEIIIATMLFCYWLQSSLMSKQNSCVTISFENKHYTRLIKTTTESGIIQIPRKESIKISLLNQED